MPVSARPGVPDDAEQIRRRFAADWAAAGASWGVAPSTAAVQGYLLVHGGPLTEAELRAALGLSHRATAIAIGECERWGLIASAPPRRTKPRGPAARAWTAVEDHWQWLRRVAAARKAREADPLRPVLDDCLRRATLVGASDLAARMQVLIGFVGQFERPLELLLHVDSRSLAHLLAVINRLDDDALEGLLSALSAMPAVEFADALANLPRLPHRLLRRLVRLAATAGAPR